MRHALLVVVLVTAALLTPPPSVGAAARPFTATAQRHRVPLRLVVRARDGVGTTVTVSGPRSLTATLGPGDRRLVMHRRLPPGRYVVTATRSTGPGATIGDGTVYRPRISRHRFRVTRGSRDRIDVTVRMRAVVRPVTIETTSVSPTAVGLSWRVPARTVAAVCSTLSSPDPAYGPIEAPATRDDCVSEVSPPSGTRRGVVDRVPVAGYTYAYGLFVKAASGDWVRTDVVLVRVPFAPRPQFAVEPGDLSRVGAGLAPDLSGDGRWVTYVANRQVHLRDRRTGTTTQVSALADPAPGDDESLRPSISADGGWVAYVAHAAGDWWVFLHDRRTGTTRRVGRAGYSDSTGLSDDGTSLVYACGADSDYGAVCLFDRTSQQVTRLTSPPPTGSDVGVSFLPSISGDGRYVAFSTIDLLDLDLSVSAYSAHRLDTRTGQSVLVSHGRTGGSADGTSVAVQVVDDGTVLFDSDSPDLDGDWDRDVYTYDGSTGAVEPVSDGRTVFGDGGSAWSAFDVRYGEAYFSWDLRPSMSADGRYVAYEAGDDRLWSDPQPAGAFLVDRLTGTKTLIAPGPGPQDWTYGNLVPTLSPDGEHVAFTSDLDDLVPGDTDGDSDLFVLDRSG